MSEVNETAVHETTELLTTEETKDMSITDRVARLLSVKSLVTVILTIVFAYLSITKTISGEQFLTIFTVIIAFYFGTQAKKE